VIYLFAGQHSLPDTGSWNEEHHPGSQLSASHKTEDSLYDVPGDTSKPSSLRTLYPVCSNLSQAFTAVTFLPLLLGCCQADLRVSDYSL
jgi:hypothetical protein